MIFIVKSGVASCPNQVSAITTFSVQRHRRTTPTSWDTQCPLPACTPCTTRCPPVGIAHLQRQKPDTHHTGKSFPPCASDGQSIVPSLRGGRTPVGGGTTSAAAKLRAVPFCSKWRSRAHDFALPIFQILERVCLLDCVHLAPIEGRNQNCQATPDDTDGDYCGVLPSAASLQCVSNAPCLSVGQPVILATNYISSSVQREVTQSQARRPVPCWTLAVRFSSLSVVMFSFASGVLELRLPPRRPSWARQMSMCLVSASYSMASPGCQHSRHRSNLLEQVISFMSRVSGPSNSVLPDEKPFSTRPPTKRILHVCRRSSKPSL